MTNYWKYTIYMIYLNEHSLGNWLVHTNLRYNQSLCSELNQCVMIWTYKSEEKNMQKSHAQRNLNQNYCVKSDKCVCFDVLCVFVNECVFELRKCNHWAVKTVFGVDKFVEMQAWHCNNWNLCDLYWNLIPGVIPFLSFLSDIWNNLDRLWFLSTNVPRYGKWEKERK